MSGRWSLFAINYITPGVGGCQHRQLALANDDEPGITCRSCGRRWVFVPDGESPTYFGDDHPSYPNMLDNTRFRKGVRVVMRGVQGKKRKRAQR